MSQLSRHVYEFGRFRLDATERVLLRDNEPVPLTPKVFGILMVLVEQSGHLVEKDELMRQVWPDSFVEEGNLTQNISVLRKALGEANGGKPYIETVPRRGYRFAASVRESWNGDTATPPEALAPLAIAVGESALSHSENGNGAAQAFVPELFPTDQSALEITAGDNGMATASLITTPPSFLSSAATNTSGPLALPVSAPAEIEITPRASLWSRLRHRRGALVVVIAVLAALALGFYFFRPRTVSGNFDSIAVLPFVADTDDADTASLDDRLVESLINNLTQLPKIRVVPRSQTANYKGSALDLQKIGRELGVRTVLTGRIRRQGDTLSIQADLVDVANVSQIWGQHYDRKIGDILLVPEDISKDIFENLRLKLSVEEKKQIEAYRLYLQGRNALNKRTTGGIEQGVEYFQKAIANYPDYAAAYAGLADCYNMMVVYGVRTPKEAFPLAQEAALKALELDDNLAEAHTSLGFIKHRWSWERQDAEREFLRAIKEKPNYGPAHQWYSSYLVAVERTDEAIAEAKRAAELDPLSFSTRMHLGWIYYMAGRYDDAIEHCQKLLDIDPGFFPVYRYIALSYEQKGMYPEAIAAFERGIKLSGSPLMVALLGHAYTSAGNRKEAERVLNELQEMSSERYVSPYTVAAIYAGLHDDAHAFEWLDKAFAERDIWLMNLRIDPVFKELRGDHRFKTLMLRVGLLP